MAGVKHTFSVNIADDASASAAGMVLPSHWNAEHTLSGVAEQSALDIVSAAAAAVSSRLTSTQTVVSNQGSAIVANSAQMKSADDAISAAVVALSAQHTSLAASVANFAISELAGVSIDTPTNGQVLKWNSANAQWVNSADETGGGGGSVTSDELSAVASAVVANSAQMTSADNAISAAVAAVSLRLTSTQTVVSNQGSAIVENSAAMTSADNAVSAAAAQNLSVTSAFFAANDVALGARIASTQTILSNLASDVSANSAQMTSADNAISAAVVALSAQHTSLNAAVVANSAALTSVASIASAAASAAAAVSENLTSLVSDVGRISTDVAGILTSSQGAMRRVLAGNQLVTATAPTSLSGFTFTVSAGLAYRFNFMLLASAPVSAAVAQFIINAANVDGTFYARMLHEAVPTATQNTVFVSAGVRNTGMTTVSAAGAKRAIWIEGGFVASGAGVLGIQVGNNTTAGAAGSAVTMLAGSQGYVWRMA